MTVEIFMTLLTACAVVTSLIVEAVKSFNVFKSNNIVALVVSIIVGVFGCIITYLKMEIPFDVLNVLYMICFVVANFTTATLGYDKVVQTIQQIKKV